jgi:hypothetical protein
MLTGTSCNSLAYAELYLTLATVLRKFDMENFETTFDDAILDRDYFVGGPRRLDSKGIRAIVTGCVA